MEIVEQFTVARPIDVVWAIFKDVPELSRCLPGAELISDNGDGSYDGRVTVKLGPITSTFDGTASVAFDDPATTITIKGRGVDKAGGSQGRIDVTVAMSDVDGSETLVDVQSKAMLAGPIAQFGRTGLVSEVSKRLMGEFVTCVHAKLDAGSPEEAAEVSADEVHGLSLFAAGLWASFVSWVKRIFGSSRD